MRVAAVYDVHANLPALEATLAAIDEAGVDLSWSAGTSRGDRCRARRSAG